MNGEENEDHIKNEINSDNKNNLNSKYNDLVNTPLLNYCE